MSEKDFTVLGVANAVKGWEDLRERIGCGPKKAGMSCRRDFGALGNIMIR